MKKSIKKFIHSKEFKTGNIWLISIVSVLLFLMLIMSSSAKTTQGAPQSFSMMFVLMFASALNPCFALFANYGIPSFLEKLKDESFYNEDYKSNLTIAFFSSYLKCLFPIILLVLVGIICALMGLFELTLVPIFMLSPGMFGFNIFSLLSIPIVLPIRIICISLIAYRMSKSKNFAICSSMIFPGLLALIPELFLFIIFLMVYHNPKVIKAKFVKRKYKRKKNGGEKNEKK